MPQEDSKKIQANYWIHPLLLNAFREVCKAAGLEKQPSPVAAAAMLMLIEAGETEQLKYVERVQKAEIVGGSYEKLMSEARERALDAEIEEVGVKKPNPGRELAKADGKKRNVARPAQ